MPPLLSPRTPASKTPTASTEYQSTSSSPNYFAFHLEHGGGRNGHRNNWSPPSSRNGSSPQVLPLDTKTGYDGFRRKSEGGNFGATRSSTSLSSMATGTAATSASTSSTATRANTNTTSSANPSTAISTHDSSSAGIRAQSIPIPPKNGLMEPDRQEARSPKRLLSQDSRSTLDRKRHESPAAFPDGLESSSSSSTSSSRNKWTTISYGSPPERNGHDAHQRMPAIGAQIAPDLGSSNRAETLPARMPDSQDAQMVTPQHLSNMIESAGEELLILDLRVSTQYARSRITGALNLCVPTTLLKRASHNVHKLAETFKDEAQRARFERWRGCRSIVVYDQSSSQLKEATTCQNVLKKFAGEGWEGSSCIVRGGFDEFAKTFAAYVDKSRLATAAASSSSNLSLRPSTPSVAPVIGGCPMPATKNAANPFFGNIRQNMDLIGGVGQFAIKRPRGLNDQTEVPAWLTQASDEKDSGKMVADKFLKIEKREQKRMQDALSTHVSFGASAEQSPRESAQSDSTEAAPDKVQIAGIEKGSKNRYTNIWPFEHSRVKLQEPCVGDCDYMNASYVETSISRKKFIATQGPLPSTFNDFWGMVWQADARVIVMLTGEREGGQVKAHNYWSEELYGPMRLKFLAERKVSLETGRKEDRDDSEQAYVVERTFSLSHRDRPFERMREITQFQYSSWPDFGVPTRPAHLLRLVQKCDDAALQYTADSSERPTVVHCSAGCGRTGTFCAVDTVVDALKHARRGSSTSEDLIEKAVEEFRLQRLSMVQSLRQFVLCYEAVLEWAVQQQQDQQQPKTA